MSDTEFYKYIIKQQQETIKQQQETIKQQQETIQQVLAKDVNRLDSFERKLSSLSQSVSFAKKDSSKSIKNILVRMKTLEREKEEDIIFSQMDESVLELSSISSQNPQFNFEENTI